jgi:hypothetical protein
MSEKVFKSEAWHQKKISEYLESKGYFVIKLISTNKNGIPDLMGVHKNLPNVWCEVKKEDGKPSKLQELRIKQLTAVGQIAIISYGYQHFRTTILTRLGI